MTTATAPSTLSDGSPQRPTFGTRFRELIARRETIRYLVVSNLKAGHRDKVLGHFWSLLDPLMFVGVYFVVFGLLFGIMGRGQGKPFLVYLSVGVLVWRFTNAAVMAAASCIRSRRGLIHEINFPKAIFPISICLARFYDFLWALFVMFVLILILGTGLSAHIAWLPLLIILQLLFTTGVCLIVAYLGAFYVDTVNVVGVGMRLWFYGSPLFYFVYDFHGRDGNLIGKGMIPEAYRTLYMLNPMAGFFETTRACLLYGRAPDSGELAYLVAVSVGVMFVGLAIFWRGEGEYAKYV